MQPILQCLHDNGIGSILDYAAEVRGLAYLFVCVIVVMRLEVIPCTGQEIMFVSQFCLDVVQHTTHSITHGLGAFACLQGR